MRSHLRIVALVGSLMFGLLSSAPMVAEAASAKASDSAARATPPSASASHTRSHVRRRWRKRHAKDNRMVISSPGFHMLRNGSSVLRVEVLGVPQVQQMKTPGQLVFNIPNSKVPVHNNRRILRTRYFNTPVLSARLKQVKDSVQLIITMRAQVQATLKTRTVVPNKLTVIEITFPPGNYYDSSRDPLLVDSRTRAGHSNRAAVRGRSNRPRSMSPSSGTNVMGPPAP